MRNFNDVDKFITDVKYLDAFENFENEVFVLKRKTNNYPKKCRKRFYPFHDLNENKFRMKYRFSKENLRKIIEIVRDDLEVDQCCQQSMREQVPIDLQILAAIRFWGGTEHPEITALKHGVSLRTLAKICKRVSSALSSKASRYIRMPATLSEKEVVMRSFQDIANMPQIIGVVLYCNIRYGTNQQPRSDKYIHLQMVCDASPKIRDLDLKSYEVMDASTEIYRQSRIKERFEQNEFRGRLLLCNNSLPCSQFLFSPVNSPAKQSEQIYNLAHAATYAPAFKCLNAWMRRFGILRSEVNSRFGSVKQTITALALLHNMSIEWNDSSIALDGNDLLCVKFCNKQLLANDWAKQKSNNKARSDYIKSNFQEVKYS